MSKDFKLYLKQLNIKNKNLIDWMAIQDVNNLTEIKSSFYYKSKSKINGLGIFASKDFNKFDYIGIVVINEKRATLARWINHSRNGNVIFYKYKNNKYPNISLICLAKRNIKKNTELKINYRYTN